MSAVGIPPAFDLRGRRLPAAVARRVQGQIVPRALPSTPRYARHLRKDVAWIVRTGRMYCHGWRRFAASCGALRSSTLSGSATPARPGSTRPISRTSASRRSGTSPIVPRRDRGPSRWCSSARAMSIAASSPPLHSVPTASRRVLPDCSHARDVVRARSRSVRAGSRSRGHQRASLSRARGCRPRGLAIVVFERRHIGRSASRAQARVYLLSELAGQRGSVGDPDGRDEATYSGCFRRIAALSEKVAGG